MGLPSVDIEVLNGQLGQAPGTTDGVVGLILSGVAVADKIALGESKQIFTRQGAKDLGLDETYDADNSAYVYGAIDEFFLQAGEGKELWIMLVSDTVLVEDVVDVGNNHAKKLLNDAEGKIRVLGVIRVPDGSYSPSITEGIDPDCTAAVLKADALAKSFVASYKPVHIVLGAGLFNGTPANLHDFKTNANHCVSVVLGSAGSHGHAMVATVLGKLATIPVQRNIGRVKDGDLGLSSAYLTDGNVVESQEDYWGAIHDKGYILPIKYAGKAGYYLNDDPTCVSDVDDFNFIARRRVINKAVELAYVTYVDELKDEIQIDDDGYMNPAVVKAFQAKIENVINLSMTANGEISSVECDMDAAQNVLSTNKVEIKRLRIVPVGYGKTIDIKIAFDNPAAA